MCQWGQGWKEDFLLFDFLEFKKKKKEEEQCGCITYLNHK